MKLPTIKLPTLSDKQKAILLTFASLALFGFILVMLIAYPLETIVCFVIAGMTCLIVYFIYSMYKEFLSMVTKRK